MDLPLDPIMRRLSPLLLLVGCSSELERPVVAISPAQPTTVHDLQAVVDTAYGDDVLLSYAWFRNGHLQERFDGPEVWFTETHRWDVWLLQVTAWRDGLQGPVAEAAVEIGNAAPVATVFLEGETASTDLRAHVAVVDVDGDPVQTDLWWSLNGMATDDTDIFIPASTLRMGDEWTVTVVPDDGRTEGEPASASVVVQNSPPSLNTVSLSPTLAYETSTLMAATSAVDADGDPVDITWVWKVNNEEVLSGDATSLDGAFFNRGDAVRVYATPFDGLVEGTTRSSPSVTIANSLPSAPVIAISPVSPRVGEDDLTCQVLVGSSDDDGDEVAYTFAWDVDGQPFSDCTSTLLECDTVPAAWTTPQVWTCVVTPDDGEDDGPPALVAVVPVAP